MVHQKTGTITHILRNSGSVACAILLLGVTAPPIKKPHAMNASFSITAHLMDQRDCGQGFTASNIDFGTISTIENGAGKTTLVPQSSASGTIKLHCSKDLPYTLTFSSGSSSSCCSRTMQDGTKKLQYQLYLPAAGSCKASQKPGDGNQVNGVGNGADQTYLTCAQVLQQNSPGSGIFEDTVIVTLTF